MSSDALTGVTGVLIGPEVSCDGSSLTLLTSGPLRDEKVIPAFSFR